MKTYDKLEKLLKDDTADLCVLVLPHNVHAGVALKCLNAGRHVVVEKPMAIKVAECTAMIEAAKKNGVCLSVYHNRRWDGDFMTIKEIVDKGVIGDVYQVELAMGWFSRPGKIWRSDKKISGGGFYDWGAHCVDWVLNLVPSTIHTVSGQFQKRVWTECTNEDHCEAYVRFKNGASAFVMLSSIMSASRPRWCVLGTDGSIVDSREGFVHLFKPVSGYVGEIKVNYKKSANENYYPGIARHLLEGEALHVTPESARRAIGVIETAEKASKTGKEQKVPFE